MIITAAFIARSSIVLLAGLIASAMLRKQPAALRHWLVAATLALAALQPLITRIVPALPVEMTLGTFIDDRAVAGHVDTDVTFDVTTAAAPTDAVSWLRVASAVWLAGTLGSLSVLLVGIIWLLWLGSHARDAGSEWGDAERFARAQLALHRPVRIAITRHPAMIVTWGVIAPVILLPLDADTWSIDRKRLVLAHEMAHLARRDWLVQLLAEIACAINWFNPLFWIAGSRLRSESEYACDDMVLGTGIAGTSYASHLVDLARSVSIHGRTWLPAPSIVRPSTLERRVRAMLNPRLNRRPISARARYALVAVLCAIALPIAAASQASSNPAGTVTDATGRPLVDATVRLTPANGGEAIETRTDANGAFQFAPVAAGDYMLAVRYPGFSASRQRLHLTGGAVTITLQAQVGTLKETISITRGPLEPGGSTGQVQAQTQSSAVPPQQPSCASSAAGGQIIPPMKVHDVRPIYRKELVDQGIEGSILMQAKIGKDGKVRSVDVISPVNADLEDAAIAAVTQWQFTPTYLNCEPVEVQMFVTVNFKIDR
jgi:TonB family protein